MKMIGEILRIFQSSYQLKHLNHGVRENQMEVQEKIALPLMFCAEHGMIYYVPEKSVAFIQYQAMSDFI